MICHLSEQVTACVASVYAVVAVGIYKLTEILVGLHESLAILECVMDGKGDGKNTEDQQSNEGNDQQQPADNGGNNNNTGEEETSESAEDNNTSGD